MALADTVVVMNRGRIEQVVLLRGVNRAGHRIHRRFHGGHKVLDTEAREGAVRTDHM